MSETVAATASPAPSAKLAAEGFGSLLIVLGGVGTAVFASNTFLDGGAPVYAAIALGFGLAAAVAFASFGPVSGGHFNPAVTLGLAAAGRFAWKDVWGYMAAQAIGALFASTLVFLVALYGPNGWLTLAQDSGFASNGWGRLSPGGFGPPATMIVSGVLTALLVFAVLGVTRARQGPAATGLVVGSSYAALFLVSIPVDNGSLNPARSLASAIYGGAEPLAQLWVFVVLPLLGAVLAGLAHRALFETDAPA